MQNRNIQLVMKGCLFILILATELTHQAYAQINHNYIIERVYHGPNGTSAQATVQYVDGLGRPLQTVQVGQSPSGNDVVQPIAYDTLGREVKKYLPYTSPSNGRLKEDALTAGTGQVAFYQSTSTSPTGSAELYPYSETVFEASPLNRVLEQGAPGDAWKIVKDASSNSTFQGHTTKVEYATNVASEVIRWEVISDTLVGNQYYAAGTLYKTVSQNENWAVADGLLNTAEEFKDLQGQILLKRAFIKNSDDATVPVETYYVYDDFGLLRYVLPPMFISSMTGNTFDQNSPLIKAYGYYYQYDSRKRMTLKQLPGAEPVYMVYDQRDRLVATQDGNMRDPDANPSTSDGKWLITKYDMLNRPVATAEYPFPFSLDSLQRYADTYTGSNLFEDRDNGKVHGYTERSFPGDLDDNSYLTLTYYDGYTFPGKQDFMMSQSIASYGDADGTPNGYFDGVKGQVTGTKVKVLDQSTWLSTTTYYDDRYRPIQAVGSMYDGVAGDYQLTATRYHFNGMVERTREVKRFNGVTDSVMTRLAYDHAWRPIKTEKKINSAAAWTTLSEVTYNEIGQVVDKKLGGNLQSVDYKYNIRGWLTGINNPSDLSNDGTIDANPDLFAMKLNYQSAEFTGATAQYNGNIAEQIWNTNGKKQRGYAYTYDGLNRLLGADHKVYGSSAWADSANYEERGISYDLNGNITHLLRTDRKTSGNTLNDFTYGYSGNQLTAINGGTPYAYDQNGNMTADGLKGFGVEYNLLNLPKKVSKGSDNVLYIYTAAGAKLAKFKNGTLQQLYAGSLVYNESKELDYILNEEGMAVKSGGGFTYQYHLKDHLGNTRAVFEQNGATLNVKQVADYYAFGQRFEPYNPAGDNKYLFAGKELQDDMIGGVSLGWYDFTNRFYDPQIGRWTTPDPLCEVNRRWSPYRYAYDNPLRFMDPDGMLETDYYDTNGDWIGTDGINNNEKKIVLSNSTANLIKGATANEEFISLDETVYDDIINLPSNNEISSMDNAYSRTETGGKEEGFVSAQKDGSQVIQDAVTGSSSDLKIGLTYSKMAQQGVTDFSYDAHTHPASLKYDSNSGNFSIAGNKSSSGDRSNGIVTSQPKVVLGYDIQNNTNRITPTESQAAISSPNNWVRLNPANYNKTITFYRNGGNITTMNYSDFKNTVNKVRMNTPNY